MSILQKLTEGVQSRDMQAEGAALLNKWEATGLLEGLGNETQKQGMAVLLENQAKELLREASSMAAGDVEGFAAVAFPIVRRVFGGLIANDLISVQPMSLPSGLIFFLDFTHSDNRGAAVDGHSVYGGNKIGSQITGGVDLAGTTANGLTAEGFYDVGHGMASTFADTNLSAGQITTAPAHGITIDLDAGLTDAQKKILRYDPDILALADGLDDGSETHQAITLDLVLSEVEARGALDRGKLGAITLAPLSALDKFGTSAAIVRRLTSLVDSNGDGSPDLLRFVVVGAETDVADEAAAGSTDQQAACLLSFPIKDAFGTKTGVPGAVSTAGIWDLEEPSRIAEGQTQGGSGDTAETKASGASGTPRAIAEIDIKVDSIAVTAQTKKLKAKWSPELGQDLNAYHNLDAEVELTGILSEQIALEIDRELLGELVDGATAGTRYWSRAPGLFVDSTGAEQGARSAAPDFTGTVSEWYETLIETINDVSAQIHRKTLRGGANFVVCSPEVANILEFTSGFRASVTADQDRGTIGAVRAGSLSKKFDVYVDPYFLRNVILVGRKGSSFLESGYVYAPYVPLQVTPTIFGTEDFVPRKGVMTRYAKKMVRPDM